MKTIATMTDHQLARSTAEKINGALGCVAIDAQAREYLKDRGSEIILASYHERDRAAPAMGGGTDKLASELMVWSVLPMGAAVNQHELHRVLHESAEKLRTLARELFAARQAILSEGLRSADLERALTALQGSNREVVAERDVALRDAGLYAGTLASTAWQLGCEEHMVDHALRARLALADDLAKALEKLRVLTVGHRRANDYADTHKHESFETDDTRLIDNLLRRWTAPQAGTTKKECHCGSEMGKGVCLDGASVICKERIMYDPPEPASRAVSITPETVVPKEPETFPSPEQAAAHFRCSISSQRPTGDSA